ncbi:MAG: diguanylate cyclase [Chloroflexi bacterium]|nr:diguanylate cyclase [Chloroflexota bacterium]
MRRLAPASLRTRLALALAASAALPLAVAIAVGSVQGERLATAQALAQQQALPAAYASRELIFGLLLLSIGLATVVGARVARWLVAPLGGLARAAEALAAGDDGAPLPRSSVPEVAHLAAAFGQMRDHLAARTAEHERAEAALRESEQRYRRIVETAQEGIWVLDAESKTTFVNRRMAEMLGYTVAEMLGAPLSAFMDEEGRAMAAASLERGSQGMTQQHDLKFRSRDGSDLWAIVTTNPLLDAEWRYAGLLAMVADVTDRKRAEEEQARFIREQAARAEAEALAETMRETNYRLLMASARAQALAEAARAAEALLDGQKRVLELVAQGAPLSTVLETLVGVVEARSSDGLVASILLLDQDGIHLRPGAAPSLPQSFLQATDGLAIGPGVGSCGTAAYRREAVVVSDIASDPKWAEGRELALQHGLRACWSTPIFSSSGYVLGTFALYYREPRGPSARDRELVDVATHLAGIAIERHQAAEVLKHQALHDALTGLPNRTLLYDRLHQALLVAQREHASLAVLVMDLDRFKEVNDTLGHHAGDAVLQQVGQHLRAALRASDTIARLGGDEFAVLLPQTDEAGAVVAARKLLQALEEPCSVEEQRLQLGASIGIALYPEHGQESDLLLRHADAAMYAAKRAGGGYTVYAPTGGDADG